MQLATRHVLWKSHVGGAPFGLLLAGGRLLVSLFTAGAVDELSLDDGSIVAAHPVGDGPAAMTLDPNGLPIVAEKSGSAEGLDGSSAPAGRGYGIVTVGADTWTCDYVNATLVRAGDGLTLHVPFGLSPFWLAPGDGGTILVAAEGAQEDTDAGGVFSVDPTTGSFTTLGRPRDPDQVVESGGTVYAAAHGDNNVLTFTNGSATAWAQGASAVALAADPALNLLVVVVNSHE